MKSFQFNEVRCLIVELFATVDPPPSAPVPEDSDASSLKEEVARSPELSVSFEPVGFSGVPPPTTQESAGRGLDTVDLTRNHLNGTHM